MWHLSLVAIEPPGLDPIALADLIHRQITYLHGCHLRGALGGRHEFHDCESFESFQLPSNTQQVVAGRSVRSRSRAKTKDSYVVWGASVDGESAMSVGIHCSLTRPCYGRTLQSSLPVHFA